MISPVPVPASDVRPTVLIVGTGLLGGSLGRALKRSGFAGLLRGLDDPEVLAQARALGAIDEAAADLADGVQTADLIVLATPVATVLDLLPKVIALAPPGTLFTDTGSTKVQIMERAAALLGSRADRFLGGHPMAGNATGGIAASDPELFRGRRWLFCPPSGSAIPPAFQWYIDLLATIGALPLTLAAQDHDRVLAALSHLPQLLATALAAVLYDRFLGPRPEFPAELLRAAGPGVADMTRLAASPYGVWRDILLTNSREIAGALELLQVELDHLRLHLRDRDTESRFREAAVLQRRLSAALAGEAP